MLRSQMLSAVLGKTEWQYDLRFMRNSMYFRTPIANAEPAIWQLAHLGLRQTVGHPRSKDERPM